LRLEPPSATTSMTAPLQQVLDSTVARLSTFSDSPQLDAQVLLAHVLDKPRTWVMAHSDAAPDPEGLAILEPLIRRLEQGEPLPYVLGHQEFFGLDFDITPDVLIPRPETELLVERAVAWLRAASERRTVADIGTGSGCIAVCLAVNVPGVRVLGTDISSSALKVALRNAHKLQVAGQIDLVQCDILPQHIPGLSTDHHFDLVCANLPYIPTGTLRGLPVYGWEPTLALDGGTDGLDPFRKLFDLVADWMAPAGRILLEIEATRGSAVLSLAYDAFVAASIHLHQDLAGRDRLLEIQFPHP
jgi:release factor glutamine methyltransferase